VSAAIGDFDRLGMAAGEKPIGVILEQARRNGRSRSSATRKMR
jgi:hypothetical protein